MTSSAASAFTLAVSDDGDDATARAAAAAAAAAGPPVAYRDEERFLLAGKLSPSDPGYYDPTKKKKTSSASTTSASKEEEEREPLLRQAIGSTEQLLDPPIKVRDPYGWMRSDDRTDRDVLQHLKAENDYTKRVTSHLERLRNELYTEMIAGIKETDHTVPTPKTYPDGTKYLYYTRTYAGQSYTSYCRAPYREDWQHDTTGWDGSIEAPVLSGEVAYLDVNDLIGNHSYCAVGSCRVHPHHPHLLAYTVDFTGNEVTQLYVKDLRTDEIIDHDPTLNMYGAIQWGGDGNADDDDNDDDDDQTMTIYYLKLDDTKRPYQLYRRTIRHQNNNNSNAVDNTNDQKTTTKQDEDDELLFQEDDELFWLHISKSFDGKYLLLSSGSKETTEVQYINLADDDGNSNNNQLQYVAKRRSKVIYRVSHHDGFWYIRSNVGGTPNLRLMISPAVPDSEQL